MLGSEKYRTASSRGVTGKTAVERRGNIFEWEQFFGTKRAFAESHCRARGPGAYVHRVGGTLMKTRKDETIASMKSPI